MLTTDTTNHDAAPNLNDSYVKFAAALRGLKSANPPDGFTYYGYDILSNVAHLEASLGANWGGLLGKIDGPIADIGTADGDLGYFLESLGHQVDLIDYPATNWNGMRAVKLLHTLLGSSASIAEVNLDAQFHLPRQRYGLVVFLGILYHLKNPYFAMEAIAKTAKYCVMSTRVAKFAPDGTRIAHLPVSYLLDPDESNNDATNYWIFSEQGLRRLVGRAGFDVEAWSTVGCTDSSEPAKADRDERAFVLLRSRHF
jgi:tRNA (mo5U34)-methyltransferase